MWSVESFINHERKTIPIIRNYDRHHRQCQNKLQQQLERRSFQRQNGIQIQQMFLYSKDQSIHTEEILERTDSTTPIMNGNNAPSVPLVDDIHTLPQQQQQSPPQQQNVTKIVVIMNANARGVSKSTIQLAQEVFGISSVWVTHTIPEVYEALQNVLLLQQSFDQNNNSTTKNNDNNVVIVTMGGDGTLATTIQTMCQVLFHKSGGAANDDNNNNNNDNVTNHNSITMPSSSSSSRTTTTQYISMISQLPIIAYVPLGTGNAVGSVVGCSSDSKEPTTTVIARKIYNIFRRMIPFGGTRRRRRRRIESRSLRQLRSTLQHIQDTILQSSSSTSASSIPVTELPMIEISNSNFTDLCFFAGGTPKSYICSFLQCDSLLFTTSHSRFLFLMRKKCSWF